MTHPLSFRSLLLLLVVMLFTTLAGAQEILTPPAKMPYKPGDNKIVYTQVIEVPNASKAVLLAAGKKYYLEKIGKISDIDLEDKDAGIINYKSEFLYKPQGFFNGLSLLKYEVEMKAVDGKFRLTFTPLNWIEYGNSERTSIMGDWKIPFPKPNGLIGNGVATKNRMKYYDQIHDLYTNYLSTASDFITKQAKSLSEF